MAKLYCFRRSSGLKGLRLAKLRQAERMSTRKEAQMRTDQYIGLTDIAKAYVDDICEPFEEREVREIEGAFSNRFPLAAWIWVVSSDMVLLFQETNQLNPWSSGPMYFTTLRVTVITAGGENLIGDFFRWKEMYPPPDGEEGSEYNPSTGYVYL